MTHFRNAANPYGRHPQDHHPAHVARQRVPSIPNPPDPLAQLTDAIGTARAYIDETAPRRDREAADVLDQIDAAIRAFGLANDPDDPPTVGRLRVEPIR